MIKGKLNAENQRFFEELLDGCAKIGRKYINLARHDQLKTDDKGGKTDGNPVSLADTEIQEFVCDTLFGNEKKRIPPSKFAAAGFLGEEENDILKPRDASGNYPHFKFIVDPLDGSKPFIIGHNHWTVFNFALRQQNAPGEEWQTVMSGAYAPEKGIAVLADNERILVRGHGWFGDNEWHPLQELRPIKMHENGEAVNNEQPDLKGVHIDLRLVSHDDAQAVLWKDLQKKGMTVRNAGPVAATLIEFLAGKQEKFAVIAGNPGGEWDWRAGEHFLKQAGFEAEFVTYKDLSTKGQDYTAFIAAGDPHVFKYLKENLEKALEAQQKTAQQKDQINMIGIREMRFKISSVAAGK